MKLLLAAVLCVAFLVAPTAQTERIFVTGQVKNPAAYDFSDGMTVGDAIELAGGYTQFAAANRMTITRTVEGKAVEIRVGVADKMQANDRLQVPRRRI